MVKLRKPRGEAALQPNALQETPWGRILPQSKGLTSEHGLIHTGEERDVLCIILWVSMLFLLSHFAATEGRKVFRAVGPVFES